MVTLVIAVLIVVVVSAFCSLCEAVLYSVPVGYIETLARRKKKTGLILRKLRRDVEEPITAILSLNTVANTAGAAVAGALAADAIGAENIVYFSAAFTAVILLFSEVIPKTIGVVYCRPLASAVAVPIQLLVKVFRPIIWICGLATDLVAGKSRGDHFSLEEFLVLARMVTKSGTIRKDEAIVIQNIIGLRKKIVRQIMTPRSVCFTLPMTTLVKDCFQDRQVTSHSRIPVYGNSIDDVRGVVYRRDLLTAMAEGKEDTTLADLANKTTFIPDMVPLDKVLRMFLHSRRHLHIAIDEHGGFAGLVTLEDVIEEVLGKEIIDSTDVVADMRALAKRSHVESILAAEPGRDGIDGDQ